MAARARLPTRLLPVAARSIPAPRAINHTGLACTTLAGVASASKGALASTPLVERGGWLFTRCLQLEGGWAGIVQGASATSNLWLATAAERLHSLTSRAGWPSGGRDQR
jgi:hypothetical protein